MLPNASGRVCVRLEYDIIFDFSASPVGGGLRRLQAYVDHLASGGERVLFLVHPQTEAYIAGKRVEYEVVRRRPMTRLWFDPRYVSQYGGRTRWFFWQNPTLSGLLLPKRPNPRTRGFRSA